MPRPPRGLGMRRKKAKVDGPGQRRNSGGRPRKRPLPTEEERVEEEAGEELERVLHVEQLLDDEDVSGMLDASSAVGLIPAAPTCSAPRARKRGAVMAAVAAGMISPPRPQRPNA